MKQGSLSQDEKEKIMIDAGRCVSRREAKRLLHLLQLTDEDVQEIREKEVKKD